MFRPFDQSREELTRKLAAGGYWPARAALSLVEDQFSRAAAICKLHLHGESESEAGRVTYAMALYRAGQTEAAFDQFLQVLAANPENQIALKHLADIRYARGDEAGAIADYQRILDADPGCRGLKSDLPASEVLVKSITLSRQPETRHDEKTVRPAELSIQFCTETFGDLYLAQGHPRQAAEIYRRLNEQSYHPRLVEKLARAEQKVKDREP